MKKLKSTLSSMLGTLAFALANTCIHAAGFQHGVAADPNGKPLVIGIWYPSHAIPKPMALGPTTMSVAFNGLAEGRALLLVVMSHGTGSSFLRHFDTAIALADAGHFDFLAPCSIAFANLAPVICQSDPGFDRVAFHHTFNIAVIDFFGKILQPKRMVFGWF